MLMGPVRWYVGVLLSKRSTQRWLAFTLCVLLPAHFTETAKATLRQKKHTSGKRKQSRNQNCWSSNNTTQLWTLVWFKQYSFGWWITLSVNTKIRERFSWHSVLALDRSLPKLPASLRENSAPLCVVTRDRHDCLHEVIALAKCCFGSNADWPKVVVEYLRKLFSRCWSSRRHKPTSKTGSSSKTSPIGVSERLLRRFKPILVGNKVWDNFAFDFAKISESNYVLRWTHS